MGELFGNEDVEVLEFDQNWNMFSLQTGTSSEKNRFRKRRSPTIEKETTRGTKRIEVEPLTFAE